MTKRFLVALLAATSLFLGSCKSVPNAEQSEVKEFQKTNLLGPDFGINGGELVLTLDDGPGPRTLEIARWLADEDVPAVFFMVGKQVQRYPAVVKEISEMRLKKDRSNPNAKPAFLIANHSMSHTTALTAGTGWAIQEISQAHEIIKPYTATSNSLLFMRPPYGALVGSSYRINKINQEKELDAYIGPVLWDIGGAIGKVGGRHSAADWDCWNRGFSVNYCKQGYLNETRYRGKGIILVHDVHNKTIDMLKGPSGLVSQLKGEGYKFVRLDKNEKKIMESFRGRKLQQLPGSMFLAHRNDGGGNVYFKIHSPESDYIKVYIDRHQPVFFEGSGPTLEVTQNLNTAGNRILTAQSYKDGKLFAEESYIFQISLD